MDVRICTVSNIKIDEDEYKKHRNICENRYNKGRKKYDNNTFSGHDKNKNKRKVADSVNKSNTSYRIDNNKKKRKIFESVKNKYNRPLIIGFSNYRKTYLRNHILLRKEDPTFIITK